MAYIIDQQLYSGQKILPHSTQLIYAWKNQQLIMHQGNAQASLTVPNENKTYVETLNGVKWVMSSHCINESCVVIGFRDMERKYLVRRLIFFIFASLLVILSIVMVAMYYAINSGLKPLNKLVEKLHHTDVSKLDKIDISQDQEVKEIKPLVSALNTLMGNMQKQLIKERTFLDTCTHELRTPVAGLVAQIQSLPPSEQHSDQFKTIKKAAHRTVRVANQFLNLAKSNNAEALSHNTRDFDLPEFIRQIITDLLASHKNINYALHGLQQLPVKADALAIEMLVSNLIENALRYGRKHANDDLDIHITIQQNNTKLILSIEDSGQGIKAKHWGKLTQRFYRIKDLQTNGKDHEGAGLGLSIVEEVAKRYHGYVEFSKSAKLGGLKVDITFHNIAIPSNPSAV